MATDRAPSHDEAADAYSLIAGRYDELEEDPVLSYMRSRSLRALRDALPGGGRLLELGCGTGTEAIAIAGELGASVVACEPSAGMLRMAAKKAAASGATVDLLHASAGDALRSLVKRGESFDGAWASFSLSYDEPLDSLRALLAAVIRPGAPFVCTLRNTFCIGEPWSFVSRVSGIYRHRVGSRRVALRHITPRGAERALAPEFTLESAVALPALLPPPGLRRVWRGAKPPEALETLDARVAGLWPLRLLGDHTLFRFRRVRGGAD